ncbi:GDSL esterase/lipase 1-like [Rosa rugosa]|uniref:GDSL esterase/lipase 1-like n=1 Tax=Rosa rugosa TaxID=74645 RepID=UPI002B405E72|nr:GDSL esterase/lipase 1-like [Rosa rugosa]
MASLSYIVYVLASLFNPITFLLYGHRDHGDQYYSSTSIEHNQSKVALFVFGDSPFEAGNDQYLIPNVTVEDDAAIAWPYGMTFFHHPTGRFSDGRIVPDFIAKFAKLPMLPPYLQPGPHDFTDGSNFASGGAGALATTNTGTVASFPMQLSYFRNVTKLLQQKLGHLEAKRILRNAVYLISIGGCDYFSFYATYPNATEPQQEEYVAIVIGNLTTVLQGIYNLGGRKIAFQNVGSLGCLPAMRQIFGVTEGCVEGLLSLANLHNTALANVLKELESQLSGFKYSIFNYYDATEDRYLNPATYGFKNGSDGCCGTGPYRGVDCAIEPFELCEDPGEYVWFDGGHSTERANFQYAKLIWSGTPNTTGPYNVQQLFQQV